MAPAAVGDLQRLGGGALDDRDELDEVRPERVAQERVDDATVLTVRGVDGREDVPLHPVALEHVEAAHHLVEGGLAALVDAVGVVHLTGAIDRDADEELVLGEELAPLVVEQRAVGLQGVADLLARLGEPRLQLDDESEEVDPHHRGLAALPRHDDLGCVRLGLDQLADVGLQQIGRHSKPAVRVEHLLGQEEAVLAVEVARRARGLGHHVEGPRRVRHGQEVGRAGRGHGVSVALFSCRRRPRARGRASRARTCRPACARAADGRRCAGRHPQAPWPAAPPSLGRVRTTGR